MWSNAGLSTSILITTCSPANGMVHHTVAKIFISTKLRDLGPKSSAARTFWRMVATCIRYQPPTEHLLWDLTTFSLASVKTPYVGTGFLGLAYPLFLPNSLDDTPEFQKILPICLGYHVSAIGGKDDVLRLAMITPLPPVGFLETVLLSLKEGDTLSESTIRRLRRKEAERRAAAAEGRNPVSEHKKRRLKRIATRSSTQQETNELSSENESSTRRLDITSTTRAHSLSNCAIAS
ncbi:hypothetical protein L210DRAFT_909840, partial [Boletus edulis BED1]